VSVDFYHPKVDVWEPAVEKIKPVFTLEKKNIGFLVELDILNPLQINLSGRMIDTFMNVYSFILRRVFERYSNHLFSVIFSMILLIDDSSDDITPICATATSDQPTLPMKNQRKKIPKWIRWHCMESVMTVQRS
jgi:hypothetical protein